MPGGIHFVNMPKTGTNLDWDRPLLAYNPSKSPGFSLFRRRGAPSDLGKGNRGEACLSRRCASTALQGATISHEGRRRWQQQV